MQPYKVAGLAVAAGVATLLALKKRRKSGASPKEVAAAACVALLTVPLLRRLSPPTLREVVGREWYEQLQIIKQVVDALEEKVFLGKSPLTETSHPLFANLSLLALVEDAARPPPRRAAGAEEAKEGLEMMKYASAAYGGAFLLALGLLTPRAAKDADDFSCAFAERDVRVALAAHCGERDVPYLHPGAPGVPSHYVCRRPDGEVILGIRGTSTLSDALTDLVASDCAAGGGRAHAGIFRAAEAIADGCAAVVGAPRRLVVVGHSLGGGAAVLTSLRLAERLPGTSVACYAFAPPPTITARETPANLTVKTYAHADDCVPQLSLRSVALVLLRLLAIDRLDLGVAARVKLLAAGDAAAARATSAKALRHFAPTSSFPLLDHVGDEFFHLDGGGIVARDAAELRRVRFHRRMLVDHFPNAYEAALAAAAGTA